MLDCAIAINFEVSKGEDAVYFLAGGFSAFAQA